MRTIWCSCGRQFVAPDDKQLFRLYRNHTLEQHPNIKLTDLQLHTVLLYAARDFDPSGVSGSSRPTGGARPAVPENGLT
jgi:hypothetical protein